ncbi:GGDEF-domain containing protein [Sphingomonas lenta]|uniref:GGDEF-domain containing protein n=1 Tax=Sphingomonas lenta TaxID=1141887 RepID=A0A2A2SJW6_9SPHN|nr:GGDEF-domain containing protein [Sphingomonas lenta]
MYVLSFRQLDELLQLTSGAGWAVVGARRLEPGAFADSGASVAVVDARGSFADGLDAMRALAPEVERAGAALLALVSHRDAGAIGSVHEAGATHFLLSPAGEGEFVHAIRFAERFAERLGRRGTPSLGRRRGDPVAVAAVGDAVRRWAAGRLAAGRPVVAARAALASFDLVNSAHGRAAGDLILDEAAERLRSVADELFAGEAMVARGSGPEFLLAGDGARASGEALSARIADALTRPFGRALVGARVGAASSRPGEDAGALLRRAGDALGPAEEGGAIEELAVELHHAIGGGQIGVLFQPQVEIASGRIVGVEALARWEHPKRGTVGADALFMAAERAGLAAALSEHVQGVALREAARWPAALDALRLSINVTAEDLAGADFADRLLARVEEAGFPRARLTVEVTETGLIADLDRAGALLGRLREAGCRTAIDDFGTGYSSLAYLNALPLDYLKVDKALVRGVERDGRERVVAQGVLALARSLGLHVVAEGVETEAQRDLLAAHGCELYQGFLCAGAVSVGELVGLVSS